MKSGGKRKRKHILPEEQHSLARIPFIILHTAFRARVQTWCNPVGKGGTPCFPINPVPFLTQAGRNSSDDMTWLKLLESTRLPHTSNSDPCLSQIALRIAWCSFVGQRNGGQSNNNNEWWKNGSIKTANVLELAPCGTSTYS